MAAGTEVMVRTKFPRVNNHEVFGAVTMTTVTMTALSLQRADGVTDLSFGGQR